MSMVSERVLPAMRPRVRLAPLAQACLAEGIGTFGLVFAGTGAIVIDAATGGRVTHVGIALTFGLIIFTMIATLGHVSGAHFNPAVTLAFASARHFPRRFVLPYVAAQIAGGLLASALLRLLFGNIAHLGATMPQGGGIDLVGAAVPHGSDVQSFLLEIVLTFFLMLVITAVATDARAVTQIAALAIGGTVGLEAMFAGPISGASMNPARSLAPALIGGDHTSLWLYIVGPIIGALLGAWTYRLLAERTEFP